ncbi:hypothetical protein PG988_011293 [Apiospora saccharicola]
MDHIIPPGDAPHPSVGFYARQRIFEPDDFFTLPSFYGIEDIESLVEHGLPATGQIQSTGEVATFLQEWLWFSFLSRMTHQKINSALFVDGNQGLDTTRLNDILHRWIKDEGGYCKGNNKCPYPQLRYIKATIALGYTRRFIVKHLSYETRDTDTFPNIRDEALLAHKKGSTIHRDVSPELTLSIAILGQILESERRRFRGDDTGIIESWKKQVAGTGSWGYSRLSREMMLSRGWCPSQVRKLESTLAGPCEVYFASTLTPSDLDGHDKCNIYSCSKSYKRDLNALHMRTCNGNCGTPIGLKDLDGEVSDMIRLGKTPLVTYDSGRLRLQYVDLTEDECKVDFGCLSHSWGDSLVDHARDRRGGNDRKMLPCQLKRMQQDFNNVLNQTTRSPGTDVPFWVDVICLPRQEESKNLALAQLRNIFSRAKATMVWDRDFIVRDFKADGIKMNVRVRLGVWSQRLWTLLETVLSREIYFGFGDEMYLRLGKLHDDKKSAKSDIFHKYHHICKAAHPLTEAIWKLKEAIQEKSRGKEATDKPVFEQKSLVLQAWLAVQFHSLERPEDEPVVLAGLLGLDPMRIMEIRDTADKQALAARRMVRLLD